MMTRHSICTTRAMAVTVLAAALAAHSRVMMTSAVTYYTIPSPNIPADNCTPRCASTSDTIDWRCDTTSEAGQVCNTIEPAGDHTCHYHFYKQQEVAECLVSQQADIIIIGASYALGLAASLMPWFDPTVQSSSTDVGTVFDVLEWFGEGNGINDYSTNAEGASTYSNIVQAHVEVDSQGDVSYRQAVTWHAPTQDFTTFLTSVPVSTSDSFSIDLFNTRGFNGADEALDALHAAGRTDRKAYVYISIGAWYYYCADLTPSSEWCGNLDADEGDAVQAAQASGGTAAVIDLLTQKLEALASRIQTEFPNYQIFFADYGFDHTTAPFTAAMSTAIAEVAEGTDTTQGYGNFVDYYGMVTAENAPPLVSSHPVHALNLAVFQRIMSVACNDPTATVECEEEVVGATTCQSSTFNVNDVSSDDAWYMQWYRPCDSTVYASTSTYTPDGSSGSGSGGDSSGGSGGDSSSDSGSGTGSASDSGSGGSDSTVVIAVSVCAAAAAVCLITGCVAFGKNKRRRNNSNNKGPGVSQEIEVVNAAFNPTMKGGGGSAGDSPPVTELGASSRSGRNAPFHSTSAAGPKLGSAEANGTTTNGVPRSTTTPGLTNVVI